jgi:hypothetical protein
MVLLKIAVVLLCGSIVGCGSSNRPSVPSLSGKWQVTGTSNVTGAVVTGDGRLQQSHSLVSGTAAISGSPCATSVMVFGSITDITVTLQLQFGNQPINFTGTANQAMTSMSGTYTAPSGGCTNGDSGTWSATKVS